MGQVALPEIDSNGQGYWAVVMHEGVPFVHQGVDSHPVSDFFAAPDSAGGAAGAEGSVALLPGMARVPADDDSEDEEELGGEALCLIEFQITNRAPSPSRCVRIWPLSCP